MLFTVLPLIGYGVLVFFFSSGPQIASLLWLTNTYLIKETIKSISILYSHLFLNWKIQFTIVTTIDKLDVKRNENTVEGLLIIEDCVKTSIEDYKIQNKEQLILTAKAAI